MKDKVELSAHAKINWYLRVGARRVDGYHDITSVLQPVSLCDRLILERTGGEGLELVCSEPALAGEDNLVCRAWRLLKEAFPEQCGGVRAVLEKHIPAQAGLGGGSADAAAMLQGLNRLFELGLERQDAQRLPEPGTEEMTLEAFAARLGADVPGLLYDCATLGSGTGTMIQPLRMALRVPLLIVKPAVSLSTGAMYRRIDERREGCAAQEGGPKLSAADALSEVCTGQELELRRLTAALERGDLPALIPELRNDFEEVLGEDAGEIEAAKAALRAQGAAATMLSGSGSAVFGVFTSETLRDRAYETLKEIFTVFPCETINKSI